MTMTPKQWPRGPVCMNIPQNNYFQPSYWNWHISDIFCFPQGLWLTQQVPFNFLCTWHLIVSLSLWYFSLWPQSDDLPAENFVLILRGEKLLLAGLLWRPCRPDSELFLKRRSGMDGSWHALILNLQQGDEWHTDWTNKLVWLGALSSLNSSFEERVI